MTPRPRNPTDLMLAPVAVQIDTNLQRLRDRVEREPAVELPEAGAPLTRVEPGGFGLLQKFLKSRNEPRGGLELW